MVSRYSAFARLCTGAGLALVLTGCGGPQQTVQKPVTLVDVVAVAVKPIAQSQVLTGSIQAHAETPVAFLTSGQLTELNVDVGARVIRDQVIARLSAQEQQADVDAATAGLQSADVRLSQAQTTLDRQKSLYGQGLTTKSALDGAKTAWETARNSRDSAQAQVNLAGEGVSHTQLLATADGVVIRRLYELGEIVQAGSPVYVIAEDGPRKAVLNVQETAIAQWERSRPVSVALVSNPSVTATGLVTEVAPALDATGTVQVKVTLDNADAMPLGSAVTVTLASASQDGITLPAGALWEVDGQPAVWVVGADKAVKTVSIQVRAYGTDDIVVSSGLAAGDQVVVSGTQFLAQGQIVETKEVQP